MRADELLLDVTHGAAAARRELCQVAGELLKARGFPLHAGSLTTALLGGWTPNGYPDVDHHAGSFSRLAHGGHVSHPAVIGSFVDVNTPTKLGSLYGEIVCSHLDPPLANFGPDGALTNATPQRRRAVIDIDAMPPGLRPDPRRRNRLDKLRETGRWMDGNGHVVYTASAGSDTNDELHRYCRWLAADDRATLRGALPSDEDSLRAMIGGLVDMLASYRQTFVRTGNWLWLREPFTELLSTPIGQGRLNRDDCRRLFAQATTLHGDRTVIRTVANELRFLAKHWSAADRRDLTEGTAWVTSLFVANAYLTEQTFGGPPLVNSADGRKIRIDADASFGLAGHWRLTPVSDEEAARIRAAYRDRAKDQQRRNFHDELTPSRPFPFRTRLSQQEFDAGVLRLPDDAARQVDSRHEVTVRLAYTPSGRFASKPVAVASSGRLDQYGLALDWPALLEVGTKLEGRVTCRGRHIHLQPAFD